MIDLYAAGTSNGLRARMALEECGLAYKLHPIALDKGEQKTPQYLALNPNGAIPTIVKGVPLARIWLPMNPGSKPRRCHAAYEAIATGALAPGRSSSCEKRRPAASRTPSIEK